MDLATNQGSPNAFGYQSMVAKCIWLPIGGRQDMWLSIKGRQMQLAGNHGVSKKPVTSSQMKIKFFGWGWQSMIFQVYENILIR